MHFLLLRKYYVGLQTGTARESTQQTNKEKDRRLHGPDSCAETAETGETPRGPGALHMERYLTEGVPSSAGVAETEVTTQYTLPENVSRKRSLELGNFNCSVYP